MKIFLTDNHAILIGGLSKIIAAEQGLEIVGTAQNVHETLDALRRTRVELLITDYNLPDEDGRSLVQKVKNKYPDVLILVLSMHDEAHLAGEFLKLGANGYLMKKDSRKELIAAIYALQSGQAYLSSAVNWRVNKSLTINPAVNPAVNAAVNAAVTPIVDSALNLPRDSVHTKGLDEAASQRLLTRREREILQLIAQEYTNKQIVEALLISERTLETYSKNIFKKTQTNNRIELIEFARANNLI